MITALNGYVILSPIMEEEGQSASGLVLQAATSKNTLKKGRIANADSSTTDLPVGGVVYYPQEKTFEIQDGMDTLVVIKESELVAYLGS